MRTGLVWAGWKLPGAALAGLLMAAAAALAAPPPVEAFFQSPSFAGAVLSPEGTRVALVVGGKDSRDRLAVLDLRTLKVQPVAAFDDGDVFDFRWVNDGRLVFKVGDSRLALGDRRFAGGLYAVNADGSGYRQLAQREQVWVKDNIGTRQLPWNTFPIAQSGRQDSDEIHVVQPEAEDFTRLLRLNTVTGRASDVDTPPHADQWLLDAQDKVRAMRTGRDKLSALHWLDPASGQWRKLREFERYGSADLSLLDTLPDGKLLVTARPGGRDTDALYVYDPATDTLADKPLLATAQYDLHGPRAVFSQGRLVGLRFTADAELTHWFDDTLKARQAEIDQLLPQTANLVTPPRRGDSPWLLVQSFSDVQPDLYHVYNSATRKLSRLGSAMPAIQPAQMSTMDLVRYTARDGLSIPAWLTLPAAAPDKKKLPLVVYVHGGPWVRGTAWRWQAEVQFLASRGYAVLQPEFRGSLGFGDKHWRASFRQWGLAMQDDLADGARWAIAQGIADPKRICVMGASYGGYATLMGLARDGELFRCGVDWVGVSDILLLFDAHWSDLTDGWKHHGMPLMIGDRDKDAAQLEATSPIRLAARIRKPLLLGHGRIDRRVPIEHGARMRDVLKAQGTPVEWVEYDKEGHGWSLPATDIDWWTRVDAFLQRHIGSPD